MEFNKFWKINPKILKILLVLDYQNFRNPSFENLIRAPGHTLQQDKSIVLHVYLLH